MRDAATAWVDGYVRAWRSNEPSDIGALFTDDARYRAGPADEPIVGRDAIVAWWLEHADAPDDAAFSFEVIGADGPTCFVQGVSTYRAAGDEPERIYDNLWVIELTDEGRARAFTEWYIRRRR
ncbi:MAG TPA: nuclear transport factor 2 family protein [Actinomycetota bacterium]|nr:nuclear transport factor 2 family protein [Actinomycetota bacterium]